MVQVISSMVDIRTSCYAARLAAFSCPQKHWKALIFRGALENMLQRSSGSKFQVLLAKNVYCLHSISRYDPICDHTKAKSASLSQRADQLVKH